jgi:adenylate cyclase
VARAQRVQEARGESEAAGMRGGNRRRKVAALLLVAAVAMGGGVIAYATHLLARPELQSIDARFSIRGEKGAPREIVFVAISAEAEEELRRSGHQFRSPLPRSYDAAVIDNLRGAGARAIALDLEFTQQTNEKEDNELIEAVERAHGKTVLAAANPNRYGETLVFGGGNILREIGARAGEVRLTLDSDGSVRRFAHSFNNLNSFPVVAAEVFTGRPVPASRFQGGTLPIDYAGPPETVHTVSYAKVLANRFPPGTFAGKLVIVGASSPILQDQHPTSTTKGVGMPGPEIAANSAATLLQGAPLRFSPGWLDVLLIALLGAAVPLGSMRVRRWRSLIDATVLAVVFTVGVQVAFNSGLIITYVYPLFALVIGTLGTLAVLYVMETIERERVRNVFARFVPGDVVEQVIERTGENLRLGGVERDCTVLFSDLRGFTSFSQSQPASSVIDVVNHYLNEMTEAILDAGGTLIAYMGDGIMAVFGAPLEQEDHADRAVAAAREMVGDRLRRFNDWLGEQGFEHRFEMGVGLHSGPVMAGNVGSEQRMEYTAIGDTTNTASRLEGMTKDSDAMVYVSTATRDRMHGPDREDLEYRGEVSIRGREQKLGVWTFIRRQTADGGEPEPSAEMQNA